MTTESEEKEEVLRRLQKTRGETFIISLPKEWIKRTRLKPGTTLRLVPQDGSLIISGPGMRITKLPREALIWVTSEDKPDLILREIDSAYLVGYDEISVETGETEMKESIRNTLKAHIQTRLTGVAIVTDSSNKLELKVVTGFEELSMKYVLRKMKQNIISMHEDAMKLLKDVGRLDEQKLLRKAEEIRLRDDLVDGLHLHGIRLLKAAVDDRDIRAKIGIITGRECLGYRLIIKSMERIGDHAAKICRYIVFLRKRIDPKILERIQIMSDYSTKVFSDAMRSLFDFIAKRPNAFLDANRVMDDAAKISRLEDEIDALLFGGAERPELPAKELSAIKIIVESLRRTAEYSSDIAEIVLNLTIIDTIEQTKVKHGKIHDNSFASDAA
jgi:phosphate uptake regulator